MKATLSLSLSQLQKQLQKIDLTQRRDTKRRESKKKWMIRFNQEDKHKLYVRVQVWDMTHTQIWRRSSLLMVFFLYSILYLLCVNSRIGTIQVFPETVTMTTSPAPANKQDLMKKYFGASKFTPVDSLAGNGISDSKRTVPSCPDHLHNQQKQFLDILFYFIFLFFLYSYICNELLKIPTFFFFNVRKNEGILEFLITNQ